MGRSSLRRSLNSFIVIAILMVACGCRGAFASVSFPWPTVPNGIGVDIHFANPTAAELQMMSAAGIRWVRMDLAWSTVEQTAGQYNFAGFDPLVSSAAQYGIKVMFILDYTNPLYDGGYSPYDSAGRTAFANYARAAVAHYQGQGIIWELYNEPDDQFWTSSTTLTVSQKAGLYAQLAAVVGPAIKNSYPNEILVGPALGDFNSANAQPWSNAMSFLETVLQAGAAQYFDAVSVHPYRQSVPETVAADYGSLNGVIHNTSYNAAGLYPPPLCGEWGYSSTWYYNATWNGNDDVKQAKYVARGLLVNLMNWIPVSIVYDWMDDGTDASNEEDNFGLVHWYDRSQANPAISPHYSYSAVQTLSQKLSGYSYSGRVSTGDSTDYVLSFTNGSKTRYVVWNQNGTQHLVTLPIAASTGLTVTSFNSDWTGTYTSSSSGGFALQTSDGPQYVVPSGQ